jgi:uncharacterized protein
MTLDAPDIHPAPPTLSGPAALFTAALIKVASRCNLDCDYCYVYKHADQSWREQPHFISDETLRQFALRVDEYVALHRLREFCVTFHGGEPLLYGAERLASAADLIRQRVRAECSVEFSLQTNATLLTDVAIDELEEAGILISLSIDGPQEANDLHRRDHGGRSTYAATASAIERLRRRDSSIFRGIIAVIDPRNSPRELFEFFQRLDVPRLDLLVPDATYVRPPVGRRDDRDVYLCWLNAAFELWFREFPGIPIRWFDAILGSRLSLPSPTDAMGLGSVSLIVVDTDGRYTDHDVFKIVPTADRVLGESVATASFDDIANHPVIREHGYRLSLRGLANECQTCPVVEACGGGSVMHRWHAERKLDAPSVYCRELFALFERATLLLRMSLRDGEIPSDRVFPLSGLQLVTACKQWRTETERRADTCAARLGLHRNGTSAAAVLLRGKAENWRLDHLPTASERSRRWLGRIRVQSEEPWLIKPFSNSIRIVADNDTIDDAHHLLNEATELLRVVDPHLPEAFAALISDVIFVDSTAESADQIFSFSDDSAPNVLYVSPFVTGRRLDADDFADSLLHEFLHQVLYHLERHDSMLLDHVFPHFPAPWREGLRPSGGFFHGTFVFAGLSLFWRALAEREPAASDVAKARENSARFNGQVEYGLKSLRQFALLTRRGEMLLDHLGAACGIGDARIAAPGEHLA